MCQWRRYADTAGWRQTFTQIRPPDLNTSRPNAGEHRQDRYEDLTCGHAAGMSVREKVVEEIPKPRGVKTERPPVFQQYIRLVLSTLTSDRPSQAAGCSHEFGTLR